MPSLLHQPRLLFSLVCAMLTNLCAGTRYAFPLFGPALAQRLNYNQLQLNIIASVGDIGNYLSAPLFGLFTDRFGGQKACLFAAICLFTGYYGLAQVYQMNWFTQSFILSALLYGLLCTGSASACMAAVSTTARNFPPHLRGSMLGLPISFYGLSAFILSLLNSWWFVKEDKNDTFGFLIMLSLLCGGICLLSVYGLRVVPYRSEEDEEVVISSPTQETTIPMNTSHQYTLRQVCMDPQFLYVWTTMAIVTGSGLLYITNVGSIARQLILANDTTPTDHEIQITANLHVALLSVGSFAARLIAGALSDHAFAKYGIDRLCFVGGTAGLMTMGQASLLLVRTPTDLIVSTLMIGSAYGSMFTLATATTSEYWGTQNMGRNWGWMSWAPGIGAQLLNLTFGTLFDARTRQPGGCLGPVCYQDTFYITTLICSLSIVLVYLLRRYRRGVHYTSLRS
jgi:MFS family permease